MVTFASENLANVFQRVIKMENQAQGTSGIRDKEPKCAEPFTGIRHFSQFITAVMWIRNQLHTDHKGAGKKAYSLTQTPGMSHLMQTASGRPVSESIPAPLSFYPKTE